MDAEFTAILQQLFAEQGRDILFNAAKFKAFLADYARGEYKKERRLLLLALEAGAGKALYEADEDKLEICKKRQARDLHEEYFITPEMAADVVDTLALVLRGPDVEEYYASHIVIDEMNQQIKLTPDDSMLYFIRSGDYFARGAYDKAITDLTQAIKLEHSVEPGKRLWLYYYVRGVAYSRKGDYDQAITDYTQAIKLKPDIAMLYDRRGDAYKWKGDTKRARADYTLVKKLRGGFL